MISSSMDNENEMEPGTRRAMFGDAFGSRGDYSRGFFYGGRRRILADGCWPMAKQGPNSPNALEPPEMFMTSRQTRKHRQQANDGLRFKLEFSSVGNQDEAKQVKAALNRKQDGQGKKKSGKSSLIVIDKFTSSNHADWTVHHQAGCTFYVNHATGEATTERPWDVGTSSESITDSLSVLQRQQASSSGTASPAVKFGTSGPSTTGEEGEDLLLGDNEEEGTGAHVYDGAELRSFLSMLDTIGTSSSAASMKSPKSPKAKY